MTRRPLRALCLVLVACGTPSLEGKGLGTEPLRSWGWVGTPLTTAADDPTRCGSDADSPAHPAFAAPAPHQFNDGDADKGGAKQQRLFGASAPPATVVALSLSSPVPPWATASAVSNILAFTSPPTFVILHASFPWTPSRHGSRPGQGQGQGQGQGSTGGSPRGSDGVAGAGAGAMGSGAAHIAPTTFEGLGVGPRDDPWRALCPSRDGVSWRVLENTGRGRGDSTGKGGVVGW